MVYALLMAASTVMLCLEYVLCFALIIVSIIGIALLKRRTKKEMRAETVKGSCEKAKKYAEEMLDDGKNKGTYMLLAASKLSHLSGLISDAAWYAFQIVQGKRNILYEGIANELDVLASEIATASEDGYILWKDYQTCAQKAIKALDGAIAKLNTMM